MVPALNRASTAIVSLTYTVCFYGSGALRLSFYYLISSKKGKNEAKTA
jgi:hypothetical protein